MFGLCPQLAGTNPFLSIQATSQGGTTPPKQNFPPNNGFPQPQRGQGPPERVVTKFKNLHKNVNFYF